MTQPLSLSILDLSPVTSGSTSAEALRNTLDLAQFTEKLGYSRFWLAEHHNSAFIASSSPEILIGHVAQVTSRIRVGSGGVMLPNHSPLKVAENFRTLEALHPHRIDLGLGRAPGTDPLTALALRRSRDAMAADDFPEQLQELLGYFSGALPDDHPFRRITAMPAGVPAPEIWLLGSSDFSAQLAAEVGVGFAFAHHINAAFATTALRIYKARFRPSAYLKAPRSMVGVSVICAETSEEAERLARPIDLAILHLGQNRRSPIASPEEAEAYPYSPAELRQIRSNRERLFVGDPKNVRERLTELAADGDADELMILTMTHDHNDRRRSYELLAKEFGLKSDNTDS